MNNIDIITKEVRKKTKQVKSIKSIKVIPLNGLIIKGIIKFDINQMEYIADKLIYGDIIDFIHKLFFNYKIEVVWI
jgi:hypothetical protein